MTFSLKLTIPMTFLLLTSCQPNSGGSNNTPKPQLSIPEVGDQQTSQPAPTVPNFPKSNISVLSGQLPADITLQCLKPFILIEENKIDELSQYLSQNLKCYDTARFEKRSYLTFALETNNVPAIKILLKIPGDKLQTMRFFQIDDQNKSLYEFAVSSPTYYPLLKIAFDMGMRKETDNLGHNLANIAWLAKDGEKLTSLLLDHQIIAQYKGKSIEQYLISAAQSFQSSFLSTYADRTGESLLKKYNYNGNQNTLLEIGTQNISANNFSLELHELYLNRNLLLASNNSLDYGTLVGLRFIRSSLNKETDASKIKQVDQFHLRLAQKYPAAWSNSIDKADGTNSALVALITSIYTSKTMDPKIALPILFPSVQPAKQWQLLGGFESHPEYPNFLLALSQIGRFPKTGYLSELTQVQIYLDGVEAKVYEPDCKVFLNTSLDVTVAQVNRMLQLGMSPNTCEGVDEASLLTKNNQIRSLEVEFYFSKVAGKISEKALNFRLSPKRWPLKVIDETILNLLSQYGFLDALRSWLSDSDGWSKFSINENRDYLEFYSILQKFGLFDDLRLWLSKNPTGQFENVVCRTLYSIRDLNTIAKPFDAVQVSPSSCQAEIAKSLAGKDFFNFIHSNFILGKKLITEMELSSKVCENLSPSERLKAVKDYDLQPEQCWNVIFKEYFSYTKISSQEIASASDAFALTYPSVLSKYTQDIEKLKFLCSIEEFEYNKMLAYSALIPPILEMGGTNAYTCLKEMLTSSKANISEILYGFVIGYSSDKVKRTLKRNLTQEEVQLIFLSNRKVLGLSLEGYKNFMKRVVEIDTNGLYFGEQRISYFESLDDKQMGAYTKQLLSLIESDIKEIDTETKECLSKELVSTPIYGSFCRNLPIRWASMYTRMYENTKNLKKSFMVTWSRILEAQVSIRKYTSEQAKIINGFLASMNYRGILADRQKGPDCCGDYVQLKKEDFQKALCRLTPYQQYGEKGPYKTFQNIVKEVSSINLDPNFCK